VLFILNSTPTLPDQPHRTAHPLFGWQWNPLRL
jgi:hypothetical protein